MKIETFANPRAAANWCNRMRGDGRAIGRTIGYVPTMGALHRGHLALIERARADNDAVCASIFVNPLQFDNPDDLKNYPRDLPGDTALLESAGCNMVFTGAINEFFPDATDAHDIALSDPGYAARDLEGAHRPRHFHGVRAIVERLFNTVGDCNAYFGEKDFQQCLVVQELAKQFKGINVIICPTIREPCGLAMSSRNALLTAAQRRRAAAIYQTLLTAKTLWQDNIRDITLIEKTLHAQLTRAGLKVDYATIRDGANWHAAPRDANNFRAPRALIAAQLGKVRLIDNIALA